VIVHTAVAIAPEALAPVVVRGSEEVARAARNTGAALVHVSSDMVFDGESGPFDEDAPLSPITDYGRAKAEAEVRVRAAHDGVSVARLSLLYRLDPPDRSLAAWLEGARGAARGAGGAYPLFTDEIRCPAEVGDVARALLDLAFQLRTGRAALPEERTVHLVGPTAITRYDFGRLVLEALGLPDSLARPALSASSGLVRPRALHLLRRTTPPSLVAGIRGPEEALAVRPWDRADAAGAADVPP
jgi:dTDP-4-dehydrorhamnose reductase